MPYDLKVQQAEGKDRGQGGAKDAVSKEVAATCGRGSQIIKAGTRETGRA